MFEIPDQYGLSSDSLRGSHQFIRLDLVGADADANKDPYTHQSLTRENLSDNEVRSLEAVGVLVDNEGYERKPEPVATAAPIPAQVPRQRAEDRAPAWQGTPVVDTTDTPRNPGAVRSPSELAEPKPISALDTPPTPVTGTETSIPPYTGIPAPEAYPSHPGDVQGTGPTQTNPTPPASYPEPNAKPTPNTNIGVPPTSPFVHPDQSKDAPDVG